MMGASSTTNLTTAKSPGSGGGRESPGLAVLSNFQSIFQSDFKSEFSELSRDCAGLGISDLILLFYIVLRYFLLTVPSSTH
jgi:hypothetical protein